MSFDKVHAPTPTSKHTTIAVVVRPRCWTLVQVCRLPNEVVSHFDVRSYAESGHVQRNGPCPLRAKSGQDQIHLLAFGRLNPGHLILEFAQKQIERVSAGAVRLSYCAEIDL